jgi:predicted kinase
LVADEIRGELAESHPDDSLRSGFSETVYAELFAHAEQALAAGRSVVLDGTFRSRRLRAQARAIASRCGASFRFVECRAEPELCRERLRCRANAAGWLAIFEHFLPLWEPPDELADDERAVLDTSRTAPLDFVESLLRL